MVGLFLRVWFIWSCHHSFLCFVFQVLVWGQRGSPPPPQPNSTKPPADARPLPPDAPASPRYPAPLLSSHQVWPPVVIWSPPPAAWLSHGGAISSRVPLAEPGATPQRPRLPHAVRGGRADVHVGGLRRCREALLSHGSILTRGNKPHWDTGVGRSLSKRDCILVKL